MVYFSAHAVKFKDETTRNSNHVQPKKKQIRNIQGA